MAMNMATAVRFYVDKIVADPKISGPSAPRLIAPLVLLRVKAAGVVSSTDGYTLCVLACLKNVLSSL